MNPDPKSIQELMESHVDITEPQHVQIKVKEDGKVIWVNVNGICVLRCCRIGTLNVEDYRK